MGMLRRVPRRVKDLSVAGSGLAAGFELGDQLAWCLA